ncbi:hypothetical protein CR513_25769, partial [Mucuna pruriens]
MEDHGHITHESFNEEETLALEGPMTRGRLKKLQGEMQHELVIPKGQGEAIEGHTLRHTLLAMLETKLLGFESLKDLYVGDDEFKEAYELCPNSANGGFFKQEGFLFKEKRLCVSRSSIRELLVKKAHEVGLMGHFGEHKTYKTLHEHFYWPYMRRGVHHVCERLSKAMSHSALSLHVLNSEHTCASALTVHDYARGSTPMLP